MSISHAKKYSFLSKSRIIQFSNYLELDSSNSESLLNKMPLNKNKDKNKGASQTKIVL